MKQTQQTNYILLNNYQIHTQLYSFVNDQVLPGLSVNQNVFWQSTCDLLNEFIPRNKALLQERLDFQNKIDNWHLDNQSFDQDSYETFLREIGYLLPECGDFTISTNQVDDEVAKIAAPQLVVPLMNARFALNAANARWGSLYDALYGTDVIASDNGASATKEYNPIRGERVKAYGRQFLDEVLPLAEASHTDAASYQIVEGVLVVHLTNHEKNYLTEPYKLVGYKGEPTSPTSILFKNNGLHIELQIDANHPVGKTDPTHLKDIVLESALTTIQDCEDSIAAVDAQDKVNVYQNWLGLMKGDLSESFTKNGETHVRTLNADRTYYSADSADESQPTTITLSGRSLQFIRNVGLLMTTDLILTSDSEEAPEGIIDGVITSLIALHDLNQTSAYVNSKQKSIYIVKPKMHGPKEVSFSNDLFSRIEEVLTLAPNTIKMGIMDEERRTSINLKACIKAAKERVAFINTGFLDRTGDEIHTSMHAGVMVRKELMKHEKWISAYEKRNVLIGLNAGFHGKAQIGKGMWATPDEMKLMMEIKSGHPESGANCAWVPSPTAATLHVIHYHQQCVKAVQRNLLDALQQGSDLGNQSEVLNDSLRELLTIPLLINPDELSDKDIQEELDNNVQGLLGYVVRWVEQGIGCSKVPDLQNVGRMEDRATLRISSQHICNWLHHGLLTEHEVMESLQRMAKIVDEQNEHDPEYVAMSNNFNKSIAFKAAKTLIFQGKSQPNGYTEPLLHLKRRNKKVV